MTDLPDHQGSSWFQDNPDDPKSKGIFIPNTAVLVQGIHGPTVVFAYTWQPEPVGDVHLPPGISMAAVPLHHPDAAEHPEWDEQQIDCVNFGGYMADLGVEIIHFNQQTGRYDPEAEAGGYVSFTRKDPDDPSSSSPL